MLSRWERFWMIGLALLAILASTMIDWDAAKCQRDPVCAQKRARDMR